MDALSQTLRVVRLSSAIFINARFSAPWCYASPRADQVVHLLAPGAERLVIFHLIIEGDCHALLGKDDGKLILGDQSLLDQQLAEPQFLSLFGHRGCPAAYSGCAASCRMRSCA